MKKIKEKKQKFKEAYKFIFGINSQLIYKLIKSFKIAKSYLKRKMRKIKNLKKLNRKKVQIK